MFENKKINALEKVGINVYDNNGHKRSVEDILIDLFKIWNKLNNEQKSYIHNTLFYEPYLEVLKKAFE